MHPNPLTTALSLLIVAASCVSNVSIRAGIVINEIYYHAPNRFENLEWIELHNTETKATKLSNWKLQRGVTFTFPQDAQIAASGYLVLCRDTKLFNEFYSIEPSGEFEGKLNNGGETIELVNDNGIVVDSVSYSDKSPWSSAPDGSSPSLERIVSSGSSNDPLNWAPSALPLADQTPTGSPGKQNDSNGAHSLIPIQLKASAPLPGQTIHVTAVPQSNRLSSIGTLELGFRTVVQQSVGDEVWLPMRRVGNRYAADIPAQAAGSLVRYRVAIKTNTGDTIYFPHPNEIRPAHSIYLPSPDPSTQLPQVHIINTREEDRQILNRQLDFISNPSSSGASFSRESMMARFQVSSMLNGLAMNWFKIAMDETTQFSEESLAVILNALDELDKAQRQLQRKIESDSSVTQAGIEAMRSQLRQSLDGTLSTEQLEALLASPENVDRGSSAGAAIQALPLESDWMSITVNIKPQGKRYQELRNAFQVALAQRNKMARETKQTRNLRQEIAIKSESIQKTLNAVLNVRITRLLEAARRSQGSPIRPNFDGLERRPPRGQSALVITEGSKSQVFDFINISTRSAGFKVRFHEDRPYRGMKTVNIIFEYNDRFVLAESLAFELYRKAGSPACLTEFVSLQVNGKPAGYHLLFEHINGSFLARNELPSDGDLYKILWWGSTPAGMHQRKGDWDGGHEELLALIQSLSQVQEKDQWQLIEKHFDVGQVATYLAVNTVLSHWDGFFNNHFSYRDPKTDKWMMFPWDQDKTWGFYDSLPEGEDFVNMPLTFGMEGDQPPSNFRGMRNSWWRPGGLFSRPLLANETFRKRFLRETKRILETIYTEKAYFPVIDDLASKLRPEVANRAKLLGEPESIAIERLNTNVESLKRHLSKRRAFLLQQDELKQL